jgi:hypothetical protein
MAPKKKHLSTLAWWAFAAIAAILAILIYPSVFKTTLPTANAASDKKVAPYQAAVTRCIHDNHGKLDNCSAGEHGIPSPYGSWFNAIKSIHVYRGVIQVRVKPEGQPLFFYYTPRHTPRRWAATTTVPRGSVNWHRIASSYCGLDNKIYTCSNFAAH